MKKNSWGGALQVGFDYALDKNWSINFDVKKVYQDRREPGWSEDWRSERLTPCWLVWAWATASKLYAGSRKNRCQGSGFFCAAARSRNS
jgi:hypothetical protein